MMGGVIREGRAHQTPEDSLSMRACLNDLIPATMNIEPITRRAISDARVRLESGIPIIATIEIGMITINSAKTIDACIR